MAVQPLGASEIPDGTKRVSFSYAYWTATKARAPFVCIKRRGRSSSRTWSITLDTLPDDPYRPVVDHSPLLWSTLRHLFRTNLITAAAGSTEYLNVDGIPSEKAARDIASALHAAAFGDPQALQGLGPPSAA
ncbi:hypothetical protein ACQEVX_04890 [Streptomyces syringium]|uniref:hypothetical protein n=1 Tax=Streptomyces syringium TaxID=76729 RepID=UPI003D8B4896